MKKKFILNIVIIVLAIICVVLLIKYNVTTRKEIPGSEKESTTVLTLDLKSELVEKLYDKLNIPLIDNELDKALLDSNYSYMYYTLAKNKTLNNEEKLYLLFNELYSRNITSNKENDEGTITVTINKDDVKDEAERMFLDSNFDGTDVSFKSSKECGIVDYLYTGTDYSLTVKECTEKNDFAKSKLIEAYKEDNYIYLVLSAFKVSKNTTKQTNDTDNIYEITNFNNESVLIKTSINKIEEETSDIFDNYDIQKYIFRFELSGDEYYLKDISVKE